MVVSRDIRPDDAVQAPCTPLTAPSSGPIPHVWPIDAPPTPPVIRITALDTPPRAIDLPAPLSVKLNAFYPPLLAAGQYTSAGTLLLVLQIRLDKLFSILRPLFPSVSVEPSPYLLYHLALLVLRRAAKENKVYCLTSDLSRKIPRYVYLYPLIPATQDNSLEFNIDGHSGVFHLHERVQLTGEERQRSYVRIPLIETATDATSLRIRANRAWLVSTVDKFDAYWDRDEWTASLSWRLAVQLLRSLEKPVTRSRNLDGSPKASERSVNTAAESAEGALTREGDHGGDRVRRDAGEAARAGNRVEVPTKGGLCGHGDRNSDCNHLTHCRGDSACHENTTSHPAFRRRANQSSPGGASRDEDRRLPCVTGKAKGRTGTTATVTARVVAAGRRKTTTHASALHIQQLLRAFPAHLAYTFCGLAPSDYCRQPTELAPAMRVYRDGRAMVVQRGVGSKKATGTRLDLNDAAKWTERERHEWQSARELVEGYKRTTPRIRAWLPLGTLTVTCSEPPDVSVLFSLAGSRSTGAVVKVRFRYSPSTLSLQVDTQMVSPAETLRTKRTAKIDPRMIQQPVKGHVGADEPGAAHRSLGVNVEGWPEVEVEAVRRLWTMRDEWARYL